MSKDIPEVPSDDDPKSRKARREQMRGWAAQARKDAQRDRDDLVQGRLEREAKREEESRRTDQEWEDEARKLLGAEIDDIERDLQSALDKPGVKEALEALQRAKQEQRGGFWSSGNTDKARRTIRKNQAKIKAAHKQAKKGWCSFVAVALLAMPAGAGYGLYELVGWVL